MSEDVPFDTQPRNRTVKHYYGDYIRVLFVIAAILLLFVGFDRPLGIPLPVALGFILLLVFAAGITNPKQVWVQWLNVLVGSAGVLFFGTIAFTRFESVGEFMTRGILLTLLNLALIGALYFATVSLRGYILRSKPDLPPEAGAGHFR